MVSRKGGILFAITLLASLQFAKIYVPEGFERPIFFKIKYVSMEIIGLIAKLASLVNHGTEPGNFRYMIGGLIAANKKTDDQVNVIDRKINGVNVRVYSPLDSKGKKLPILIFYHGGGYFMGFLNAYDSYMFQLVKRLNLVAISVDYRKSPEYAHPIPTTDCYIATKYVFQNAHLFNGDAERIILAGDSAGGNVAAVLTQKFHKEGLRPKMQILIYPWTQMFDLNLPSAIKYKRTGIMSKYSIGKCIGWYLGYNRVSYDFESLLESNNHTTLLNNDLELKNKLLSYLDVSLIPAEYKKSRDYYKHYNPDNYYPTDHINDHYLIQKDKKLKGLIKKTWTDDLSPGLADEHNLKGLPRTYFILVEWDTFKDQGLIYSERLRRAGVDVDVAFYDTFHGVLTFIDENLSYQIAFKILDDLVLYIEKNI